MKRSQTLPLRVLMRRTTTPAQISIRGLASAVPSKAYLKPTHNPTAPPSATAEATVARFKEYMLPVYDRPNFVLSHGKGSYIWDTDGNNISTSAQVISEEAGKLIHTSNVYHNEWAPKLAESLVKLTQKQGGLGFANGKSESGESIKVFFANSGTEANEGQRRERRTCTKNRIVCFENSFHGRSMGALSVTSNPKYQKPFQPLIPNVDVGKLNDIAALESLITEDTCGVIVEPIQGEGGINSPTEEWLRALRKRCNEVDAVLIYDEIQCGLYRTGSIWAHTKLPIDCHPDVITMAKPLANGFPIGALMAKDHVASPMGVGTHGTTFGGSPLSCAIGFHVVQRLSNPSFVEEVAETSRHLDARLLQVAKWYPGLATLPGKIVELARERGVFFLTAGKDAVRLVPSLNVKKEEVDLAVDVLESCLHVCSEQ
ncbi:pyridoxal phosphate-dependent transferase [Pholiota molesta]|nr:pyridoxal phosphate-dependent transferase [Pholiota molesta]